MKKRIAMIAALVCTLAMALPAIAHADSTVQGQLIGPDDQGHIEFGSYPQTEIVGAAGQSGVYGKAWAAAGDYLVDGDLYARLQSAKYDDEGDTTLDGTSYRRIKKSDATYYTSTENFYSWSDSSSYHYFRYDPITWRVLSSDGSDAFLMAETALDDKKYNASRSETSWESCTLRSWLNGSFIDTAFTSEEQAAIKDTDLADQGTTDKVFLLAKSEVFGDGATAYGFSGKSGDYDTARRAKSSTYAKAMGTRSFTGGDYLGNCYWCLRSQGSISSYAAYVNSYGSVNVTGYFVDDGINGTRPALHLDLGTSGVWNYSKTTRTDMTLSQTSFVYDGTGKEPAVTIDGLTQGEDFTLSYSDNVNAGTATVTATGTGDWTGSISQTYTIERADISGRNMTLSETSFLYDGTGKEPAVTMDGLTEDVDFAVKYRDNTDVGTGTTIVVGIGNYDGTLEKNFDITWKNPKKLTSKKVKIYLTASKFTYSGDEIQPGVKRVKLRLSKKKTITLTRGRDFTLSYSQNINAGKKARITITGKNKYKGSVSRTFTIRKAGQQVTAALPEGNVYVGDQCRITVASSGSGRLIFTSGDRKKVTVSSDGIITAKKAGTVKIWVRAAGNGNYRKSPRFKLTLRIL